MKYTGSGKIEGSEGNDVLRGSGNRDTLYGHGGGDRESWSWEQYLMQKITINAIIPLGTACRPAFYLRRHNLRYFSSPFDWMMRYKLESIKNFVDIGIDDFFREYTIVSAGPKNYNVVDLHTNMISMHSFTKERTMEEQYPSFLTTMKHRFDRFLAAMRAADRLCFISNRSATELPDIFNFVEDMEQRFAKSVLYVNVIDEKDEEIWHYPAGQSEIITIAFDDAHPMGRDKATNPKFWLGNAEKWNLVCRPFIVERLEAIIGNAHEEDLAHMF